MSKSGSKGNYQFALEICQQPQRARMCGFGDKDRRPITPPPCIRLRITDSRTGKEVDISEFEGNFFVLQVDLWDEKGEKEVNIVRASSSSPAVSISTATTTSYPPPPERPMISEMSPPGMYIGPDGQPYMAQNLRHPSYPGGPIGYPNQFGQQAYPGAPMPYMPQSQNNSAMFTRNLIGSLTVNASKLEDPEKKPGFWFVLQDLSVRTEGFFRYVAPNENEHCHMHLLIVSQAEDELHRCRRWSHAEQGSRACSCLDLLGQISSLLRQEVPGSH